MDVRLQLDDIKDIVIEYLEIDSLNSSMKKLKQEFDLNPFDEDGDPYVGFWPEMKHNLDLINDVVLAVVQVLENVTLGAQELQAPEKLDVAVGVLDDALDLPWYAEMFDGPALKIIVSQAVNLMNSVNWDYTVGEIQDKQKRAEVVLVENGGQLELSGEIEKRKQFREIG